MARNPIDLTSTPSAPSRLAKRAAGFGAIGLCVAAMAALYACDGDDNSTPPPVVDAGPTTMADGAPITVTDGSPVTNPDGSPVTPDDGGADSAAPPPACSSLPGTVVYIESGDTQEPLLKALGQQLRNTANVTIVFELTGSCTLTPALYGTGSGPVPIPANTPMLYIPSTTENPSWTTSDAEATCTTAAATPPDLGISALFPSSCAGLAAPPANIGQWNGPTQAYTFIVPNAEYQNGQTAIWAEEAYYAFGDGVGNTTTWNGAAEWDVPAQFFLRPKTKSTLVSTAFNIHLTATQMTASEADGGTSDGRQLLAQSTQVLSGVQTSPSAQAIGILGDEVYDANRGDVKVLAFRDFGQTHAFFPDSTETSFDKQNIRDGHYTLWSPTVYIAPATAVDGGASVPTNPTVAYIVDTVLGNPGVTLPDGGASAIDGLKTTVGVGLTPTCAMQVQRTGDGAPLTPYAPVAPCTCKFLSEVPNAAPLPASCATCTTSATCPAGSLGCFNGFCETAPAPFTGDAGVACDNTSIINACTNATPVDKTGVVLPTPTADGGLQPVTE